MNPPRITDDLNKNLKKPLALDEIKDRVKTSVIGKKPGNDSLGFEIYVVYWDNILVQLFESYSDGLKNGILSPSQRQQLLEKKGKDKRFKSNWRPISLKNSDAKLLAKCYSNKRTFVRVEVTGDGRLR
jgi:hypothetical protein